MTNFLASITVTLLSLLHVISIYVPPALEGTLAFILFPLNACVNPLINTLTTKNFVKTVVQLNVLDRFLLHQKVNNVKHKET